jgi:hypothetical protein
MSIGVEVIEAEQKASAMYYPYLAMSENGSIVLFIEDDYGVCLKYVSTGQGCQACWVGAHRKFDRSKFKPMPEGASVRIFNRAKK